MQYLSVCSGIEAASVAWEPLGWRPWAFSEIDPFACAVLARRFPTTPNLGDMNGWKDWPDATLDVLCGGTPCQSYSIAGRRAGLDDPRGDLMLTFAAIARRYRPRWLVWENVPGVLSSGGGRDFGTFLGLLAECGYGFAHRVLDAQFVRVDGYGRAVPQRRERVFLVGCLGDWRRAAAVLLERESLRGDPAPRREAGARIAACFTRGAQSSGRGGAAGRRREDDTNIIGTLGGASARAGWRIGPDEAAAGQLVAGPLMAACGPNAHGGAGLATLQGAESGHLIVAGEVAATITAGELVRGKGHGKRSGSSAEATLVAFGGNDTRGPIDVAACLNANRGCHNPGDFEAGTLLAFTGDGEVADPLSASEGRTYTHEGKGNFRLHNVVGRVPGDVIPFDPTQVTHPENRSNPQPGAPCHTLPRHGAAPAIAFQERGREGGRSLEVGGDVAYALTAPDGGGRAQERNILQPPGWVRRLTPTECERLMGFPDGWTDIRYRGKPAKDGPRYKALGNSWAVNCARWVGRRIALVDTIPPGDPKP